MNGIARIIGLSVVALVWSSCSILPLYSSVNEPAPPAATGANPAAPPQRHFWENANAQSGADLASEDVPWDMDLPCRNGQGTLDGTGKPEYPARNACPRDDANFVAIAISGGGSRASVFSTQVLFELERYGLLQQVDVISSVSGGSYTSALYALSCDPGRPCPETVEGPQRTLWQEDVVFPLLERNFIARWIWNWFWPDNMVRYWLTYYDRTDVMAEVLSDNLFDNSFLGNEGFRMQDLNPQRPNLVINATDNTFFNVDSNVRRHRQGRLNFTFTRQSFAPLKSDLDSYPVAYAVAASSAFPGAFQYVTLRDYSPGNSERRYVHLFDGGTSENLGLWSIDRMLERLPAPALDHALVILIDAYVPSVGKDATEAEPRGGVDYFVDTNFLDAYDSLMTKLRDEKIRNTKGRLRNAQRDFVHLTFDALADSEPELFRVVSHVPTDLAIDPNDALCLRRAAQLLVRANIDAIRANHPGLQVRQVSPQSTIECDTTLKPEPTPEPPGR